MSSQIHSNGFITSSFQTFRANKESWNDVPSQLTPNIYLSEEYNEFAKSVKKPCLVLASSLFSRKSQLEQMSEITAIKFKGISDLMAATVQNVYARLIKPNTGTFQLQLIF